MNSSLLNIWRENGAYLRFGDAKNGVLLGVTSTLLYSFLSHILIMERVGWHTLSCLLERGWPLNLDSIALLCFLLATVLTGASIVPVLTKWSLRVSIVLVIGKFFGFIKPNEVGGVTYFLDIAGCSTLEQYKKRLEVNFDAGEISEGSNLDLIEQIWIVSRIAAYKHIVFVVSGILAVIGILGALFR